MAESQLLEDLNALDDVTRRQIPYENLKRHPEWNSLTDAQKDELFRVYVPGNQALRGANLKASRETYEGQIVPELYKGTSPPGTRAPDMTLSAPAPAPDAPLGPPGAPPAQAEPGWGQYLAEDIAGPAIASAGAAQLGRMAGAPLGPLGVIGGGMVGAGAAEYARQRYKGEEFDPWKIGITAGTEGLVGPVVGLIKKGYPAAKALYNRLPGKVAAAGREAAQEVRPELRAIVPHGDVDQAQIDRLFNMFRTSLATNPPPIPTPNIQAGIVQTAQKWPLMGTGVPVLAKLDATTQRLKNILMYRNPVNGQVLPPAQVKATINELYQELSVLGAEIKRLPEGDPIRASLMFMRGSITRDIRQYANSAGAHPAARLLNSANEKFMAFSAVERLTQIVDSVLIDPSVAFDAKIATRIATKIRNDAHLQDWLSSPAEIDALVRKTLELGGKVPKKLPPVVLAATLGGGGGMAAMGVEAAVRRDDSSYLERLGRVAEGAVGGTLVRLTPEMIREATKIPGVPDKVRVFVAAIAHGAERYLVQDYQRQQAEARRHKP